MLSAALRRKVWYGYLNKSQTEISVEALHMYIGEMVGHSIYCNSEG